MSSIVSHIWHFRHITLLLIFWLFFIIQFKFYHKDVDRILNTSIWFIYLEMTFGLDLDIRELRQSWPTHIKIICEFSSTYLFWTYTTLNWTIWIFLIKLFFWSTFRKNIERYSDTDDSSYYEQCSYSWMSMHERTVRDNEEETWPIHPH